MLNRFLIAYFLFLCFGSHAQKLRKVTKFYDKESTQIKEVFFFNDKLKKADSLFTSYYPSGSKKSEGHYKKGDIVGSWVYFHENGNLKAVGDYANNKQNGFWRYYFENGSVKMEGTMLEGKKTDLWKTYYENNILKSEGTYYEDKQDGFWVYYDENGDRKGVAKLDNGDGEYFEYYENGNIKVNGFIKNGTSDSLWTYYYEDGVKKSEGYEKNGQKNGLWKSYYPNGALSETGNYKKGKPNGNWKYLHKNGKVKSQGDHNETGKSGKWSYYYDTGDLKGEAEFNVGGNGEYKEYYSSGKLKAKGTLKEGKNEGHWEYYYETGEKEGEADYKNGSGLYTGYYLDGTKKMEGDVSNGQKMGNWSLYDENGVLKGIYKHLRKDDLEYEIVSKIPEDSTTSQIPSPEKPKKDTDIKPQPEKWRINRPKANLYKSFIVSTNPAALGLNQLPFYLEYYIEKKKGFEIQYTSIRTPFFTNHNQPKIDKQYLNGYSITFKNKFYKNPKINKGMWYLAYDLRYTNTNENVLFSDSSFNKANKENIISRKTQGIEATAQFGDRFIKKLDKPGITLDVFLGIGIGYKQTKRQYTENEYYDSKFSTRVIDGLYLPLRLGFNVGYLF